MTDDETERCSRCGLLGQPELCAICRWELRVQRAQRDAGSPGWLRLVLHRDQDTGPLEMLLEAAFCRGTAMSEVGRHPGFHRPYLVPRISA